MDNNKSSDEEHDDEAYCKHDTAESDWFCDTLWKDVKNLQHMFVPIFPKKLKKDFQYKLKCELPYPIFDPIIGFKSDDYWMPFRPKLKKDTRREYYKKLYSNSKNKILIKDLKKNVVCIPKYLVDIALSPHIDHSNEVWCFTGGILDCIEFNKSLYLANVVKPNTVRYVELNSEKSPVYFHVDNSSCIYSVKSIIYSGIPVIATRQHDTVSLFSMLSEDQSCTEPSWALKTESFIDVAFNKNSKICSVGAEHIAELRDISTKRKISQHTFTPIRGDVSDNLAQILFLDESTMAFMNRCCLFVYDWRCNSFFVRCFKEWFTCDELCSISKKDDNKIYIASAHNVTELDIRSLNCVNKVMHMMSTPPFIFSVVCESRGYYLSLLGPQITDKVTMYHRNDFNIPQYVSNINDTLRIASTRRKLKFLDFLQERLTLTTVGMKVVKHPVTDEIIMYTSNSVGDVFQQRIFYNDIESSEAENKLVEWSEKLPLEKTVLDVTSMCNLSKVAYCVTTRFPNEKNLNSIMNKDTADLFWKKYSHITKIDNASKVGEAMNTIWVDKDIPKDEIAVSTQDKVMEWLQSNY